MGYIIFIFKFSSKANYISTNIKNKDYSNNDSIHPYRFNLIFYTKEKKTMIYKITNFIYINWRTGL